PVRFRHLAQPPPRGALEDLHQAAPLQERVVGAGGEDHLPRRVPGPTWPTGGIDDVTVIADVAESLSTGVARPVLSAADLDLHGGAPTRQDAHPCGSSAVATGQRRRRR